jgi:hypothetical protein
MVTYSVSEAAHKLGISNRAVQKRCKKEEVRKKDNKYLITDLLLKKWNEEINSNVPTSVPTNVPTNHGTQDQNNRPFIEYLQQQPYKNNNKIIEENEALKLEIKLLKEKLSEFDLKDNERIEIFTNEMYQVFEKRLLEWTTQKQAIEQQDRLERELNQKLIISDITIRSKREELTLHKDNAAYYKAQAEYKDKQNNKLTASFDKLIETIATQSKDMFTKTAIEAKKMEWTKKK